MDMEKLEGECGRMYEVKFPKDQYEHYYEKGKRYIKVSAYKPKHLIKMLIRFL